MAPKNASWIVLISLVLTLGLAACNTATQGPGGGGNGGGGEDVSKLGYVVVDETSPGGTSALQPAQGAEVFASAVFWGLDDPLPTGILNDPYSQVEDQCDVFSLTDPDPIQDIPFGDFNITFLDAGPSITIQSQGAAYATLPKEEEQGFIFYTTGGQLAGPIAPGLTATVPGTAEFPAFTNESIPDVGTFSLTSNINVDASSQFTWTPSGEANTVVVLTVSSTSFAEFTTVTCTAEDDGQFSFPAATQQELGQAFSGQVTSAGRQAFRIVQSGEAALFLGAASTTEYELDLGLPFGGY